MFNDGPHPRVHLCGDRIDVQEGEEVDLQKILRKETVIYAPRNAGLFVIFFAILFT